MNKKLLNENPKIPIYLWNNLENNKNIVFWFENYDMSVLPTSILFLKNKNNKSLEIFCSNSYNSIWKKFNAKIANSQIVNYKEMIKIKIMDFPSKNIYLIVIGHRSLIINIL